MSYFINRDPRKRCWACRHAGPKLPPMVEGNAGTVRCELIWHETSSSFYAGPDTTACEKFEPKEA